MRIFYIPKYLIELYEYLHYRSEVRVSKPISFEQWKTAIRRAKNIHLVNAIAYNNTFKN